MKNIKKKTIKISFYKSKLFVHVFMVIAAFPLAKIGLLLLKQLSKPVANMIKNEAKKHPQVRKYVIVPTGKAYRWIEDKSLMHLKGLKPHEIERITEEEAVELGSNAIGEIILFGFLSVIVLAEYNRQGDKKAVLQKSKEEEIINLQDAVLSIMEDIQELKKTVEKIQTDMETATDALEMEEQRHVLIHDHNFWDAMISHKKWPRRRKKESEDMISPSI